MPLKDNKHKILVCLFLIIAPQNECFRGYTCTGISLSVSLCVCLSVYPSVYKILVSVKELGRGIKSHLVTALVSFNFDLKNDNFDQAKSPSYFLLFAQFLSTDGEWEGACSFCPVFCLSLCLQKKKKCYISYNFEY